MSKKCNADKQWNMQDPLPKMLIFDIDGTLAESDNYLVDRFMKIAKKCLPFLPERGSRKFFRGIVMLGETVVHFFYRILDLFGVDALLSRAHEKVSGEKDYHYEAVDGMCETLRALKPRFMMSVVTSGGAKSTEAFLKKFQLEEMFDIVVTAQDCCFIKPSPAPLNEIIKKFELQPEDCLLIGDTIFDVLCAHRAKVRCAAVKTGFDTEPLIRLFHADYILDSVVDLPELLNC